MSKDGSIESVSLRYIMDIVDRIWSITETGVAGLLTYYLIGIERMVAEIKQKLAAYKFKDSINIAKKCKSRRGGSGRGKK